MTDERRFGGGDESRVQALMAENAHLRKSIANSDRDYWYAEVERLREENELLWADMNRFAALSADRARIRATLVRQREEIESLREIIQRDIDKRRAALDA